MILAARNSTVPRHVATAVSGTHCRGATGSVVPPHDQPRLHQPEPLPLELRGEGRVVDKRAGLDVALLAAAGEVGARDEGALAVDGDALGVQAAPRGASAQGPAVAVELRVGRAEGPVGVKAWSWCWMAALGSWPWATCWTSMKKVAIQDRAARWGSRDRASGTRPDQKSGLCACPARRAHKSDRSASDRSCLEHDLSERRDSRVAQCTCGPSFSATCTLAVAHAPASSRAHRPSAGSSRSSGSARCGSYSMAIPSTTGRKSIIATARPGSHRRSWKTLSTPRC